MVGNVGSATQNICTVSISSKDNRFDAIDYSGLTHAVKVVQCGERMEPTAVQTYRPAELVDHGGRIIGGSKKITNKWDIPEYRKAKEKEGYITVGAGKEAAKKVEKERKEKEAKAEAKAKEAKTKY